MAVTSISSTGWRGLLLLVGVGGGAQEEMGELDSSGSGSSTKKLQPCCRQADPLLAKKTTHPDLSSSTLPAAFSIIARSPPLRCRAWDRMDANAGLIRPPSAADWACASGSFARRSTGDMRARRHRPSAARCGAAAEMAAGVWRDACLRRAESGKRGGWTRERSSGGRRRTTQ